MITVLIKAICSPWTWIGALVGISGIVVMPDGPWYRELGAMFLLLLGRDIAMRK